MHPTRRERRDPRWAAFYRNARCRDYTPCIREDLHLYAVAQGAGGSFFHWWCTLVSAGHLGPAGVDGGRVPITQHTNPPSSPPSLPPPSERRRCCLCSSRMQRPEKPQFAGGRTNDRLPTCASLR